MHLLYLLLSHETSGGWYFATSPQTDECRRASGIISKSPACCIYGAADACAGGRWFRQRFSTSASGSFSASPRRGRWCNLDSNLCIRILNSFSPAPSILYRAEHGQRETKIVGSPFEIDGTKPQATITGEHVQYDVL